MPLMSLFCVSVLLHNAIPFVGFGFLDNAIMIAAVSGMSLSSGLALLISEVTCLHLLQYEKELIQDQAGLTLTFLLFLTEMLRRSWVYLIVAIYMCVCSQGTQIELSIGVTFGISTMAGLYETGGMCVVINHGYKHVRWSSFNARGAWWYERTHFLYRHSIEHS